MHGLEDGQTYRLEVVNLDDDTTITITVEVNREPLTGMTDMSINLDGWRMAMSGDSVTIGATMFATFHDTHPNCDVNVVSVWKAKESTLYSDDDIEVRLKEDWNHKSNLGQ